MRFLRWTCGLVVGLVVGWALGRLYAPASGQDFRSRLSDRYREVATESRRAAEAKRHEMEERYHVAKRVGRVPASSH